MSGNQITTDGISYALENAEKLEAAAAVIDEMLAAKGAEKISESARQKLELTRVILHASAFGFRTFGDGGSVLMLGEQ